MKRIILLLILSFSVMYNYAQTKEECIKYIKTRFKARYSEGSPGEVTIIVKLEGTKLIIKTPSLGKDIHVSTVDLLDVEDVVLNYDDQIPNYQLTLFLSKKSYIESILTEEGGVEKFTPKSSFTLLGYDEREKADGEKMCKIVKHLAKLCGAKVLDIK